MAAAGMRPQARIAGYRQLREQPVWKLLAADHAPELVGLLQALLLDGEPMCILQALARW
ncbi:hypothetical protein HF319_13755 [Xanthomonas sp. Kuri4-1]